MAEAAAVLQADLALVRLDHLRFSVPGGPLAALVLSGGVRAGDVMVGRRWAVADGGIPGLDQHVLRTARRRSASRVFV